MIFNSVTFLVLLVVTSALYWCLPRRPRLWILLLASCTFYGFWRWEFLPLLFVSTATDYFAALGIHASDSAPRRRLYLGISLTVNLGLLFYFKYLIFFAENAASLLQVLGFDVPPPAFSIVLPLGISFYTFQTISYSVDVYRRLIRPERDFALYGCYVTFFPQLVAGPILRAREVIHQLDERPPFSTYDLAVGIRRVLFGLFLKVVLADNLAPIVDDAFAQPLASLSALDVWTMAFLFGFQIYFDFAGYSHIALGCARIMGISFPENFAFPYLATSPREFWRRWHISLSSWIRDYLYLPLAGERVGDRSTGGLAVATGGKGHSASRNRALFATWAIMGLWHGAAWTFVLWGVYHACFVYLHRILAPRLPGLPGPLRDVVPWMVTLCVSMLGWIPFRASSLPQALGMLQKVLLPWEYTRLGMRENYYLIAALTLLAMVVAWATQRFVVPKLEQSPVVWNLARVGAYGVVIALVFVFLRPINQFIYFQF